MDNTLQVAEVHMDEQILFKLPSANTRQLNTQVEAAYRDDAATQPLHRVPVSDCHILRYIGWLGTCVEFRGKAQ